MVKNIITKIKKKDFSVCVIGLGYVGLPLASRFIEKKIKVYGIDNDLKKIKLLRKGKSYINIKKPKILDYFKKNPKNLSNKYNILKNCDVVIVCLPTPLKKNSLKPDMSYVFNSAKKLVNFTKKNQTIILESTVYPGASKNLRK